ncbi:MAG: hypothetical protein JW937_04395 [Candidatus Omnitrophica bacterium]|nr:hypothetical protein [Candidatus Omnitrophota bacterium]
MSLRAIARELRIHAPFTALGTLTGIVIMSLLVQMRVPRQISVDLFWILHPLHVVLSAVVTVAMYRLHTKGSIWKTILIGYLGSVGIASLSDCIIPYLGECILNLPHRGLHLGALEKWWVVNPLAGLGIAIGLWNPATKLPHAGHVFLSTWASLFHISMALGTQLEAAVLVLIAVFLFLAVWIPCCTSDIVFPLLFAKDSP